jgi:hypothetical protein
MRYGTKRISSNTIVAGPGAEAWQAPRAMAAVTRAITKAVRATGFMEEAS